MSNNDTAAPLDLTSLKSIVSKLINDEKFKLFLFGAPIKDVNLISTLLQSTESGGLLESKNCYNIAE